MAVATAERIVEQQVSTITIAKQKYYIRYTENPREVLSALKIARPSFFTFDTETTGLHLKKDRPFLAAVCFSDQVYVFEANKGMLTWFPDWAKTVEMVYAHNTTYDMHMLGNVVGDKIPLQVKNWGDTMGLARLSFEAVSTRDGGDSLKLKAIGKKHIDSTSDRFEKDVKAWLKAKKMQDRKELIASLKQIKDDKGRWSISRFEEESKKKITSLPVEVIDTYENWRTKYQEPTYQDVPLELMIPYLAVDVILTKITVEKFFPVVVLREQLEVMQREFKLIPVVYKMERAGIKVNREYLMASNKKLGDYIFKLYTRLYELTGMEFSASQHTEIKKIYAEKLGYEPDSTDKKFLSKMADDGDEVATIISRLRRLEKWKETYIERILEVSEYDGRFYSNMNAFNPVSGRFSGDSQQFPKDPIYTEEGYNYERSTGKRPPESMILYHPRQAFEGHMWYLDYSQVELRMQSHYTLFFGGDTNLCRAYMPYNCVHYQTGKVYDFKDIQKRKEWSLLREGAPAGLHWEEALKEGWSAWINPDTNESWIPTDVHSSTTLKALEAMGIDIETLSKADFKYWRSKGKMFNFMR